MIVVDVEASGTEYHLHSILSVGALDFSHPENRLYLECRAWDGAHINEEALNVCGFSREEATDPAKMSEEELIRNFLGWIESVPNDRTLAGQNVSFDRDFLKAASLRGGMEWPLAYRTIDTHTLAVMHHVLNGKEVPLKNHRSALDLDAVLNYVGIPNEPEPHNALTGALSHAEVISRLLYGKKLLPEFESFDQPWES
jgi:DNA polymerase III epsilon subunit-like protein